MSDLKGIGQLIEVDFRRESPPKTVEKREPLEIVYADVKDFDNPWPLDMVIIEAGGYRFRVRHVTAILVPPHVNRPKKRRRRAK